MKRILFLLLLLTSLRPAVASCPSHVCPSTGTPADIITQFSRADPGDTITLPASQTLTWSTNLLINAANGAKPVTIAGAGVDQTIVTITSTGRNIDWQIPNGTDPAKPPTDPVNMSRLTGIYFKCAAGAQMRFEGTAPFAPNSNCRFRWDHCKIEAQSENWIDDWIGVIDHVDFIRRTGGPILRPGHHRWDNGARGHKSWSEKLNWNTDQFIYIEDCRLYADGSNGSIDAYAGFMDATSACRLIVRHCTLYNGWLATHGNDTGNSIGLQNVGGGTGRGIVAFGKFRNHIYLTSPASQGGATDSRSGVEVAYGNRKHITPKAPASPNQPNDPRGGDTFALKTYRQYSWPFPWGGADGNSGSFGGKFDNNDTTTQTLGPGIYFRGVTSGPSSPSGGFNAFNVTINKLPADGGGSPGWGTNLWTPKDASGHATAVYYLINKTVETNSQTNNGQPTTQPYPFWSGVINSHTASAIEFQALNFQSIPTTGGTPMKFNGGETVEIRKINTLMDQCGVHGGTAWSGDPANNTVVMGVPDGKNDEVITSSYYWDNYVWNDNTNVIGNLMPGDNFNLRSSREGPSTAANNTSNAYHFYNFPGFSTDANGDPLAWHVSSSNSSPGPTPPSYNSTTDQGFTEYTYPHPMVGGASISSSNTTTFIRGQTNNFPVTTTGFTGTPVITLGTWSPSAPSNVDFGTPNCAANTLCGNANGATLSPYTVTISAVSGSQNATQGFTLNTSSPNTAPVWPVGPPPSFTATPTSGVAPLNVALAASPTDDIGVTKVEFYRTAAVTSPLFGSNHLNAVTGTSNVAGELDDMRAVGGHVVRIDVDQANNSYPGGISALVSVAKTKGFTDIILIYYANLLWTGSLPSTSCYTNGTGCTSSVTGNTGVVNLAAQCPDCYIELSNEPNLTPSPGVSAAQYATLAKNAYAAIKAAHVNTKPVLLGSVGNSASVVGGRSMYYWCLDLVNAGCVVGQGFDWANYHNYGLADGSTFDNEVWWHVYTPQNATGDVRTPANQSCQIAFGNPFFVMSEFGMSIQSPTYGTVSEATQAAYIGQWMEQFKAQPNCKLACQFALADNFTAPGFSGFGLRKMDLSHRPSWDTFLAEATPDPILIKTVTSPPFNYTDPGLPIGTYSYSGKAYDGSTPSLSTTSSSVTVTVSATPPPSGSPTPATISVRP